MHEDRRCPFCGKPVKPDPVLQFYCDPYAWVNSINMHHTGTLGMLLALRYCGEAAN